MQTSVQQSQYLKIQEQPAEDRPRERLIAQGINVLSNAELLGILIGSGIQNMTSVDLAKHLLKAEDYSLGNLAKRSVQELTRYRGIGYAKAAVIASAMELSQRRSRDKDNKPIIDTPSLAYRHMVPYLQDKLTEECWVMLVNRQKKVLKIHQISKGGLARTTVDPKVVFKIALDYHAHGIILAHNHPSGDPTPSEGDIAITHRIVHIARHLDIKVLEHVIIAGTRHFSFLRKGLL